MNKRSEIEPAESLIERHPLLLVAAIVLSCGWGYFTYTLFRDMNPAGFLVAVPGVILAFQTLWYLLHPFAAVYKNRLEIRHSMFSMRQWFFGDIRSVIEKNGRLYIVYHDDDTERVNLLGIKPSHRALLIGQLNTLVKLANIRPGDSL